MAAVQPNQFKIAVLFLLYLAFVWTLHRFLAALPGLKKVVASPSGIDRECPLEATGFVGAA